MCVYAGGAQRGACVAVRCRPARAYGSRWRCACVVYSVRSKASGVVPAAHNQVEEGRYVQRVIEEMCNEWCQAGMAGTGERQRATGTSVPCNSKLRGWVVRAQCVHARTVAGKAPRIKRWNEWRKRPPRCNATTRRHGAVRRLRPPSGPHQPPRSNVR